MSDAATQPGPAKSWAVSSAPVIFAITVFASAALIFLVEPMIAKMVLPKLGGSPMVWNTSMAFFQAALLVGYGYAHLLQRVKSLKAQVLIHALVLLASAAVLPLRVSEVMGAEPGAMAPGLWLLGVLTLSLGAPFAALSASAPLAQAWYARVRSGHADASNPYVLYAASNLGSLIALLVYPTLIEPAFILQVQRWGWSAGYVIFIVIMALTAWTSARYGKATPLSEVVEQEQLSRTIGWKDRLIWIALAAAPSSLMLGVTTHITTDIASAPFLWVVPLALYLLTFIIAFSNRKIIDPFYVLVLQAALMVLVTYSMTMPVYGILFEILAHLATFFFSALMCHMMLAQSRPHPSRLTEFYLLMSLGGVIGGAFNAFLAPVIFNNIFEYPLVLVLICLARPWGRGPMSRGALALGIVAVAVFAFLMGIGILRGHLPPFLRALIISPDGTAVIWWRLIMAIGAVSAFLLRDRAWVFASLIALMVMTQPLVMGEQIFVRQERSFFGVLRMTTNSSPGFSDSVHVLAHGTTLHGAEGLEPDKLCTPLTYYAHPTPIGQVFDRLQSERPSMSYGAVGMGAGTVAAYVRAQDRMRFFEIDKNVIDISTDPQNFYYIKGCAKGPVDWKLGDARLSLQNERPDSYDILLVDAFSSDAIPAHLLTVQAMKLYLSVIKPDGVIIMHLSNRHLELASPVAAVVEEAGGHGLYQLHSGRENSPYGDRAPPFTDPGEEVIIVSRSPDVLLEFAESDAPWSLPESHGVRAWTDDYTNLFGAMARSIGESWGYRLDALKQRLSRG